MTEKIEYETVTVKVPTLVMEYLRKTEDDATKAVEFAIVDHVRAEMEGMTGMEYIDVFGLGLVFYAVLDDKHYKPGE